MNTGLIALDNFSENPDKLREVALNCEYQKLGYSDSYKFGNAPWPGKMSASTYSEKNVDVKISNLLKKNLRQMKDYDSGKFRISKKNDIAKNLLHVDSTSNNFYAGVLYLTLPEHCINEEGTIFYTRKITGLDHTNRKDELKNIIVNDEFNNLTLWDKNLVSYMVYNRLIVYPSNKFHGIGKVFGDTDQNARLVQIFFWEELI